MTTMIRRVLLLLAALTITTGYAEARPLHRSAPVAAYNTQFGITDPGTGWIDFPLHSGNRRVWMKPSGSDSNDCLSFATACATWDHTYSVYRTGHTGGDQLMVGGPGTYTDNGLVSDFQDLASGISMTYPNAVLSYDITDPTNSAKYGKIVGIGRPVLILPPTITNARALQMTGGTGSGNFAVQGLDLDAQGQPDVALGFNANSATQHNGIVFQNVRFKGVRLTMGLGPPGPASCAVCGQLGGPFLISKSSGYGQWTAGGNFSFMDVNFTDGFQEQEVIGIHAGWRVGVSRDDPDGGPNFFGHGRYYAANSRNGKSDFTVWANNAVDGDNLRGGMVENYTVSLNEPTVGTTGGFSSCTCEAPYGVFITRNTGLVMGGQDLSMDNFRGSAWGAQNLLPGSTIQNFLLLANPKKGIGHNVQIVGPCANSDMIDEYLSMKNITAYGYSDQAAGDGTSGCGQSHPEKIFINWQNSKLDQLVTGPGNSVSSPSDFPGSAPWTSIDQLATAMGASSIEDLYNRMVSRPDLPWARALVTAAFTAHGKSQPLSGVPPPASFTPDLTPFVHDVTAPVLSAPTASATSSTTATIGVTTNEGQGRVFAVVTTSSTQPADHFVIRGLDATGQPVGGGGTTAFFAGSVAVTTTGAQTISATGLTTATTYFAHFAQEDPNGNVSNVVSTVSFTTP